MLNLLRLFGVDDGFPSFQRCADFTGVASLKDTEVDLDALHEDEETRPPHSDDEVPEDLPPSTHERLILDKPGGSSNSPAEPERVIWVKRRNCITGAYDWAQMSESEFKLCKRVVDEDIPLQSSIMPHSEEDKTPPLEDPNWRTNIRVSAAPSSPLPLVQPRARQRLSSWAEDRSIQVDGRGAHCRSSSLPPLEVGDGAQSHLPCLDSLPRPGSFDAAVLEAPLMPELVDPDLFADAGSSDIHGAKEASPPERGLDRCENMCRNTHEPEHTPPALVECPMHALPNKADAPSGVANDDERAVVQVEVVVKATEVVPVQVQVQRGDSIDVPVAVAEQSDLSVIEAPSVIETAQDRDNSVLQDEASESIPVRVQARRGDSIDVPVTIAEKVSVTETMQGGDKAVVQDTAIEVVPVQVRVQRAESIEIPVVVNQLIESAAAQGPAEIDTARPPDHLLGKEDVEEDDNASSCGSFVAEDEHGQSLAFQDSELVSNGSAVKKPDGTVQQLRKLFPNWKRAKM